MGGSDLGGGGGVEFWRAEAERWRAEAQRLAADEVVLRARVADLEGQVGALAEKVSVLARMAFGASSEKAARPAPGGDGATGGAGTLTILTCWYHQAGSTANDLAARRAAAPWYRHKRDIAVTDMLAAFRRKSPPSRIGR